MSEKYMLYERESHGAASNVVAKGTSEDVLAWALGELKWRLRISHCDEIGKGTVLLESTHRTVALILDPPKEPEEKLVEVDSTGAYHGTGEATPEPEPQQDEWEKWCGEMPTTPFVMSEVDWNHWRISMITWLKRMPR